MSVEHAKAGWVGGKEGREVVTVDSKAGGGERCRREALGRQAAIGASVGGGTDTREQDGGKVQESSCLIPLPPPATNLPPNCYSNKS